MNKVVMEAKQIEKHYFDGQPNEVRVLNGIDLKIHEGDIIAIMGPSGSGKTTLLDILGCLMRPSGGEVHISGVNTGQLDENSLAKIRRERIGFVFQQYNLVPSFTALENVEMPMRLDGKSKEASRKRAMHLLDEVGLGERMNHKPNELSGGEQQRVAIARSLANNPKIILADEPTGNLDSKTGERILNILRGLNKKENYTIVMVTHDPRIREVVHKVINLMDGKIIKEEIMK